MTDQIVPRVTASGKEVTYAPEFYDDLRTWQDRNPDVGCRVVDLVLEVVLTPGEGRGRPKRLTGVPHVWTRRVTRTHRLVYTVTEEELRFHRCYGHEIPETLREEMLDHP